MTAGNLIKSIFFIEILKGVALTLKHLFKPAVTRRYPKVKRPALPGFRGLHALVKSNEGNLKCVGCGLCGAVCPSQCIHIFTSEGDEHNKVVERYEIEVLRCIYCGFCVEACPYGAVALSEHYEYSDYSRDVLYMTKDKLLSNWDKYFAGQKGERYLRDFWRPMSSDFTGYEGQAMFNKVKAKGKEK